MKTNYLCRIVVIIATLVLAFSITLFARGRTVFFHVMDELGNPLIGATIIIKGTTKGACTDLNGNAELSDVKNSDKFTVSYLGYFDFVDVIGNGTNFQVSMTPREN